MFYYRAYHLNIQSDIPLGKIEQTSYCAPDVIIRKTSEIPDIPANASRLGNKYASLKNQLWITDNQWSFYIEGGNTILYQIKSVELTTPIHILLTGACFGCLLQQRNLIVLHANTVCYPGQSAFAISGHTGAGKSTAAAFHIKQGALLAADDITAIEFKQDIPHVLPGFPRLKLWNDSREALHLLSLESLYSYNGRSKHHIDLKTNQHCSTPVVLEKLVIIKPDLTEESELFGKEKIQCLLANNYTALIFHLFDFHWDVFKNNLKLARQLKIYNAPRPTMVFYNEI
ncbi:TPA: hypothetical protein ACHW7I_001778 [Legionella pneumophila]|uniref:HPr kinase n=1 Tax=Legionella pneumophila subsp. pneumophila TaxID=91891 RepID=A0AAV2V1D7_LEGPN|nr:hypothetical protein [Legionella pneumophila]MCK1850108.1 hypothetical protein [Legionella pneumophila]MCZ4804476.1 hypothetical protein [Legionella pneumophila]MDI9852274.1 hypothetical protein [Legionella pneumophila]MDW8854924.1 hypothetical protein [Legionella pneumophila]MDW8866975.1 hypothetical protein [Legionella pneumophila]